MYNLEANEWSALAVDAATPLRRACHAAGVVGKKVSARMRHATHAAGAEGAVAAPPPRRLLAASSPPRGSRSARESSHSLRHVRRPNARSCQVYLIGGRYWDVAEDDYIFLNDIQILETQPSSTFAADWRVRHPAPLAALS